MSDIYLNDAGEAINSEIITQKDFLITIGDPDDIKLLKFLYVWATPISTLRVYMSYDGGDFISLGDVKEYPQRFDLGHKKCRYIQIKLTESSTNKRFIFDAYEIIGDKMAERP